MPIVERGDILPPRVEIVGVGLRAAGAFQCALELSTVTRGKARIVGIDRPRVVGGDVVVQRLRILPQRLTPIRHDRFSRGHRRGNGEEREGHVRRLMARSWRSKRRRGAI